MVGLDPHAVLRLTHRHFGGAADELGHHALVVRVEMLDDHERHAGARRHVRKKALEGLQASCRGAHADHGEE